MRGILSSTSSNARSSSALVEVATLPVPVEVRAIRTARRLRLRFDERRYVLKLTCPARMSRKTALAWAADQRDWVDAQLALAGTRVVLADGTTIPLEGQNIQLRWSPGEARQPRIVDGQIVCGGPAESFGRRIETFLKKQALQTLSHETAEYTAKAGLSVRSISIGDADTRWGSCSAMGRIRYNWRLILAPPVARRFVVAHEVAHLVHLNHGPDFKALEKSLCEGNVAEARALLRRVGPALKRIARSG
jgi:predicted metal-dependent hydrolase